MARSDASARPPRVRLAPEVRRQHIVEAARRVFSRRPYSAVSMSEIAAEAGVARSLIHHYFAGMRELYLAVVAEAAMGLTETREAGPDVPLEERLSTNIAAALERVGDNRESWLAIVGRNTEPSDPQLRAIVEAGVQRSVERGLALNSDVLDDTPTTRLALLCFHGFTREAIRAWIMGLATREEAHALIVTALHGLIADTIPRLERGEPPAAQGSR